MAFKVAGRSSSDAQRKAPSTQAPSPNTSNQGAFSFKPQPSPPKPVAPRPALTPSPQSARRPAPVAPKPAPAQAKVDHTRWHGRTQAPPPRGSSYGEFEEWAADGLIPDEYTAALALDYYMGFRSDEPEEEAPAFRR
jgi:hypothetical protein